MKREKSNMKKHRLSHKPSDPLPPISAQEEKEMIEDFLKMNASLGLEDDYLRLTPKEFADCVKEGLINLENLSKAHKV